MIEVWKNIPGYDGKYQASREGQIRRVYPSGKTRLMKPFTKKTMQGSKRLVVNLTMEGKSRERILMQLIAITFLGPTPEGYVAHHRNGCQSDNYVGNIEYISKKELGKKTGAQSGRRSVIKINDRGEIVDVYSSAREAARKNYMSRNTISERCNGKCKSAFAPDGYAYAWEDKEVSIRKAIAKIEKEIGYIPKAADVVFEW